MILGTRQMNKRQQKRSIQGNRSRETSPQIRIYNRNVYLRQAYKSLMNKKYEEEIQRMANSEKLDVASYRILKQKVQKFIEQGIRKIISKRYQQQTINDVEEKQYPDIDGLSYEEMCEVIFSTNDFIKRAAKTVEVERLLSQIWLYLKNYDVQNEFLPIQMLSTFLNILMDPKGLKPTQIQQLMMTIEPFHKSNELKNQFIRIYPQLQDQALEDIDIFKLWFSIKQKNNLFPKHQQNEVLSSRRHITQQIPNFQPRISQNSRVIARKSLNKYLSSHNTFNSRVNTSNQEENQLHQYLSNRSNHQQKDSPNQLRQKQMSELNYHEILYRRKLQKQLVSQKVDENQYRSEQNIRKATPSKVKQIVQKMYFVPQKKLDVDHKALQQQRQLQACTFHPTTIQYPNNRNQNVSVQGFQKEVNRLKKGRQEKEKLKQTYENLGKPKNLPTRSRTPSFLQRNIPKLILEVNIGAGRIQKIKLQGNEDAKIVAKKFINKHSLQSSMLTVLEQLIDENLRSL